MDEEKYQKELFEFEKPKRTLPRLSDFFPKADFERNVVFTLTLDRVVFIIIGIVMVMVVVYALGVERGKVRIEEAIPETAAPVIQPVVKAAAPVQTAPVNRVLTRVAVPAVKPAPVAQSPAVPNAANAHTIVAVTLTRKEAALQEADKLKKCGFNAAISQSGRYWQVCIGTYANKTSSQGQKDLRAVKRLYKDAYLR